MNCDFLNRTAVATAAMAASAHSGPRQTTTVFGGHGKRNEFVLSAHLQLLNGGTEPIGSPGPIGVTAGGFLKQLVIEPIALVKTAERSEIYHSLNLGPATFFD